MQTTWVSDPATEPPDFSLALGGPLFQIYRRAHLSGDALELLHRRVVAIALFAWSPLCILAALGGDALGGVRIPFLYDVETHTRFLVALPLLVAAEVFVHRRVTPLARRFVERGIVAGEDVAKLHAAVRSAVRVRNSLALEVALLILVYTFGLWVWRTQVALDGAASWYASPGTGGMKLTAAGYWYVFVSIPIFQFMLVRWAMRLLLWFRLLWQVSRLDLHLSAAHPDHAGGIGFLGSGALAFQPVLAALGAVLAGVIASHVLYDGQPLLSFKMEAAGLIAAVVTFIFGPLVMFTPHLDRASRKGRAEYGLLANRYVFGFEQRWIRGDIPDTNALLGTSDLQSLADLGNSYAIVGEMRIVPFSLNDVTWLAAVTALPLLPLTLTIFSLEEVVTRLVQAVF